MSPSKACLLKNIKYSVIVPIYNDGYLAQALCEELKTVFESIDGAMELIFINDGSVDDSLIILSNLISKFYFVRVVDLSRNFGQHQAISCGFKIAKGAIIFRMNVDMQDPPSEIPKLLAMMERENADLVVGRYKIRNSPFFTKLTSHAYFRLFKILTGLNVEKNTAPLRAMSRRFITAYNSISEKSLFPQGLDLWLGFKQCYVEINHCPRVDKRSSYTLYSRCILALDGLLYFSDRPIKFIAFLGFILAFSGFSLGAYIIFCKLSGYLIAPGYASLASITLIAFGCQLTSLGILGLYIGKIFKEVKNRPSYIIRKIYDN